VHAPLRVCYLRVFSSKKSRKIRLFQVLIVKASAFSYVVVAIIALEYFPVFEFHLHVNSLVFLVFEIYFQAIFAITFIQTGWLSGSGTSCSVIGSVVLRICML